MNVLLEENKQPISKIEYTQDTLILVAKLCDELRTANIGYCHWKSNAAIERSASGGNDLDLLVRRDDIQQFKEILLRLGFKECLVDKIRQLPGVQNYLGYDTQSDRFVHVHAHYQLILGHDLLKNYHIPIERPYIESASKSGLFNIPSPEFELIIFVIRMIIKHSTWDTILLREGKLSVTEKRELDYLEEKADDKKVSAILSEHLPFINQELFNDSLQALRSRSQIFKRMLTGRRIQNCLCAQARHTQLQQLFIKNRNRAILVFQSRILKKKARFMPANSGALIAIIGGDGAGKTTAIESLYKWLAPHFDTAQTHMGKPRWSWSSFAIRGALKLAIEMRIINPRKSMVTNSLYNSEVEFTGYAPALSALCTANDRYRAYKKARRLASNGSIVLCDRFPIPRAIPMDGPRIGRILASCPDDRILRYLNRKEQALYQQIMLPDILIVLLLDPESAVKRKSEEDPAFVHYRASLIWQANWSTTPAIVIDASLPKDSVLTSIKTALWTQL